jgi:hypothetical protein
MQTSLFTFTLGPKFPIAKIVLLLLMRISDSKAQLSAVLFKKFMQGSRGKHDFLVARRHTKQTT